jgi:hypothetical protein
MEVSGQLHSLAYLDTRKEPPIPIQMGDWVIPRAGLDAVEKEEFPALAESSSPYPVAILSYFDSFFFM